MNIHVSSKCLSRSKIPPAEAASVVLGRPWDQPSFIAIVEIHDDSVVTISVTFFFLGFVFAAETCQMCPLHFLQQMLMMNKDDTHLRDINKKMLYKECITLLQKQVRIKVEKDENPR